MNEQMVAIVSFQGAIKRELAKIKKRLAASSEFCGLSEFRLDIEATGRVNDGDIKIIFKLSDGAYSSGDNVAGNDIDAVLAEFLRRKGWTVTNKPLMLTVNEQVRADADRVATPPADKENPF